MKLPFLPICTLASRKFRPARSTAFFAAIIALFFVAALHDANAQDSTTNTNEYIVDPYSSLFGSGGDLSGSTLDGGPITGSDSSGSFGSLSFGGDGGLPLDGGIEAQNQATVTYTMQTGNFNSLQTQNNNNPPYAGTYNNGATELANYANSGSFGNTPGAAAFQTFSTTGNGNTGTARAMQVGDTFTITAYIGGNPSVGGYVGISFRDSTTYSSFSSATDSATEARFQLDNTGGWKVYNSGTAIDSGLGSGADRTFTIKVTSANTFNATIGSTTYYDLSMAASGGTIDSFAIYTFGDSNSDSFWKSASLSDTGTVEFGNNATNGVTRTISGVISDGLAANSTTTTRANAVTVSGGVGSQINFSGNNTYTGATTVNANAALEAQNANALGTTAAGTTVNTGGVLKLYDASGITYAAEALTINGDGTNNGALRNVGGANTWQGAITLGADSRIGSSSGTLTISGGINLQSNTLYLGGDSNITLSSAVSNAGKTSGNGAFWWDGTGTLRFNTAQSALSGNISLRSGTVLLAVDSALGTGAVTVGQNSALTIASADTTARTLGNNITMSTSDRLNLGQSTGGTGNLTLNGTLSFGAAGGNHFLNVAASTTKATIAGIISGASKNLIKEGSGTLSISANNTYSGGTYIDAGTLELTAGTTSTTLLDIGTTTAGVTASAATLRIAGADGYSLSPNMTINTGGSRTIDFANASGNNTLSGTITANKDFAVISANSGRLSGAISGAGGLNKAGSGTLLLSGNNTYTGTTTISNGVLVLSNATSAIGNTNIVTLDNTAGAALTVALNETIGSLRGGGTTGGSLNVTNGATLTVAETNSNTYAGVISGAGGFTKSGAGTTILSGNSSSYSGAVSVSAGAVRVADANALGDATGSTTVSSGAALEFTAAPASEALSISGTGINSGGALRNISGNNTLGGLITLGGASRINSDAGTLTLDVSSGNAITGTQNLTVGGAGNVTINDGINISTGTLTKDGAGILTIAGTQSYSGATTVTNGTLVMNGSARSSAVSVGNATADNGSVLMGTGSVGATTIDNNGRISPGNSVGTLSVNTTLNFNAGGDYLWEINNVSGSAGTTWDLITVDTGTVGNELGTLNLPGSGQFTVSGIAIDGYSFPGGLDFTNNYFKIVGAASVTGSIANLSFNNSGLGTGSWTFATNGTGLYLNYNAPGVELLFNNSTAQNQGAANIVSTNNAAGAFSTITNQGTTTAVIISNTAPLTFTNADNSYTGATIVAAGSLVTTANSPNSGNGAFGNSPATVQVGSTNSANSTAASLLIGAADVTVGRGVTINAGGTGTRTVGATNNSGVALYSGNITANTNVTLSASNSGGTTHFSGAINGLGAVSIAGSGNVLLSGANTFTNTVSIASGSTLIASNNSALGGSGGAGTTVNSGGVLAFAGNIVEDEAITISGTGISSAGALRNVNGVNTNTGTITLAANATISADSGTTLQLGNINNGTTARQLTFDNAGTVVLAGNLSNMDTTSTFFKTGSGSLVISNTSANTGGGQLQVGQGTVTLAAGTYSTNAGTGTRGLDLGLTAGSLGSASDTAFYVNNGVTMSNSIYVAGGGGARILGTESTTGTATFNNEIYLDSTARLTAASGGTALFSGNFVNTGGLTKVGNGIVILAGTNANSGAVTISNGTLAVTNGSAINNSVLVTVDSGATLSVLGSETVGQFTGSGTVSVATGQQFRSRYDGASNSFAGTITGSGEFLKGGTGTLTLSGANDYAGQTTHEAGVLLIGNNSALGTGVYLVDFNNATNKTIAANGTGSFTLSQSNNVYNDLTLGEATGNTGKLTFAGGTFLGNEVGETRTLTVAANNNHEFSGGITGNRGIIKAGSGTLTLSGNNTFGNTFQLNEGTVLVGNNNAFGTGFVQVQFDIAGTKTIASASTAGYTIGNNVNVFNDLSLGLASVGTGALTFSGTVYLGDEIGQNRIITTATGTGHTVSGAVTGNRGIVKQGAGSLTLSGVNTSSGGLYIDNGAINLNGGSIAFSLIDIGSGNGAGTQTGNDATLRVTSGSFAQAITVNNEGATPGNRTIEFANSSGSATLSGTISAEKTFTANVANSAATGVLSGVISNNGGLTKTGDGTLTLSGASANTYTGLTTVSAGTLNLNKSSGNAIAGATTINSGAVLLLSASNQVDSGAGDTITLSGGTIRRGGNVSEVFGNLSLTEASFLDYGAANAIGTLSFGTYTPSSLLTVQNFLPGNVLTFGSDLTSSINNASLFSLGNQGFTSSWNSTTSTFTITAIPEPSTYLAAAGLLALFLWPLRRRMIKASK